MIDLFYPPAIPNRQPDLIHRDDQTFRREAKLSAEERNKRHLANRAEQSKRYRLKVKLGKAPALVEAK